MTGIKSGAEVWIYLKSCLSALCERMERERAKGRKTSGCNKTIPLLLEAFGHHSVWAINFSWWLTEDTTHGHCTVHNSPEAETNTPGDPHLCCKTAALE